MRSLFLSLLFAASGCYDGLAPPVPGDAGADAHVPTDDMFDTGDGGGQPCQTACDCPPGDRCERGTCRATTVAVFCCGTAACTGDNLCQQPDGRVGQCNLDPDAGFTPAPGDAGVQADCVAQACQKGAAGTLLCKLACRSATADCVGDPGTGEHCMP